MSDQIPDGARRSYFQCTIGFHMCAPR